MFLLIYVIVNIKTVIL